MTTIEYADPLNVIIPIWKGMRNCIFARTFTKSSVKPLALAMGSSQRHDSSALFSQGDAFNPVRMLLACDGL